jgi:hypothetical protein
MMLRVAKLGIAIAAVLALIVPAAYAGQPDLTLSYYTPQSGSVASPTTGAAAAALFKACPNNDGGTSLPGSARIKVVLLDGNQNPIAGVLATDICMMFNGGTPAQGFTNLSGADSVIANSTWNQNPLCPNVTCVAADAPTDTLGVTYITFTGTDGTVAGRGVGVRNPNRKWGHYDSKIPVFVGSSAYELKGKLTDGSGLDSYVLRIKNFDVSGGLGAVLNQGETVTTTDFNTMVANLNKSNPITYWLDYNNTGTVTTLDYNQLVPHLNHNCRFPFNP